MAEDPGERKSISEIIREGTAVEEALDKAFYRAVLLHREAKVPMSFFRGGKVVLVDPEEIPIPPQYANLTPFRY